MRIMVTAVYPSSLLARALEAYQQFISPYKGFRCAHRAVHGRDSCSQFAKRVALKRGLLALFPLLRRRFTECSVAAQVLDYETRETKRKSAQQRQEPASSGDASPCDAADCIQIPTDGCGNVTPTDGCGSAVDATSAPADCAGGAGGADCASADCASCDVF